MRQEPRANIYRDAWAGELRVDRCGTEVRVAGWVHRRRDHGGLIFIDLRDREGLTQLVFDADVCGKAIHDESRKLRSEWVISVTGQPSAQSSKISAPAARRFAFALRR